MGVIRKGVWKRSFFDGLDQEEALKDMKGKEWTSDEGKRGGRT
jgi:hypothetical protein